MSRPLSAIALLLLLTACAADTPPAAAGSAQEVRHVKLSGLSLPLSLPSGAELTGAWELRSTLPITGLSAMALEGERLLLATDMGELFETRCPAQRSLEQCDRIWHHGGRLVARGAPRADIEALAIRPDGSVVLGLENYPRLALLEGDAQDGYRLGQLADAPDLRFLPRNQGPEAVAALPDGRLVVVPEGSVDADGVGLLMLQDPAGAWHRHRLQLPGKGLLPVEAAVAGDYLFVLLRSFGLLAGWHGEIMVLPLADLKEPGEGLERAPQVIAKLSDPKIADNYEAMAVRQLPDGSYSLLVASDDNGFALQRKLVLNLTWTPQAATTGMALSGS